jgi:hypothetical protein
MKVVFISGPYRANSISGVVKNIRTAEKHAVKYWKLGYMVYCPHKNTALLDGACPDEVWLKGNLEMLRRCDIVVMLPGWDESEGSVIEHNNALEWAKDIIYDH